MNIKEEKFYFLSSFETVCRAKPLNSENIQILDLKKFRNLTEIERESWVFFPCGSRAIYIMLQGKKSEKEGMIAQIKRHSGLSSLNSSKTENSLHPEVPSQQMRSSQLKVLSTHYRMRLALVQQISSFALALLFGVYFAYLGAVSLLNLLIVMFLIGGLTITLARKGKIVSSIVIYLLSWNIYFYLAAATLGEQSGWHLLLFTALSMPYGQFELKKNKMLLFFLTMVPVGALVLLYLTDFSFSPLKAIQLTESDMHLLHRTTLVLFGLVLARQIVALNVTSFRFEDELSERLNENAEYSELLKGVIDSVPGPVSVIDNSGKYVLANSALLNSVGVSPSEFVGKELGFLSRDNEFVGFLKNFLQDKTLDRVSEIKRLQFGNSGELKWYYVSLMRITSLNVIVCVSINIQNEILLSEENAHQKLLIESTNKMAALGQLAGGLAHEINNPLAIIDAHSGRIARYIEKETIDKETIKKSLNVIDQTVQRVVNIIDALRAFSKEGTRTPFESIGLQKLVENAKEFVGLKFRSEGVALRVDSPPNLEIECREGALTQVLVNLLNNSFEAVEKLDERWVQVSFLDQKDYLSIFVTDSGRGISSDISEKIMNPFFTTKPVGKGTGLGLSISKGLIESHNGRLYYDKNSTNTRFVVEIPKRQVPVLKAS